MENCTVLFYSVGWSNCFLPHPNICGLVKFAFLFQVLDESIYSFHLSGNVDILRTVLRTFVAACAVVGLSQFGHRTVVTDEERASRLAVGGVL